MSRNVGTVFAQLSLLILLGAGTAQAQDRSIATLKRRALRSAVSGMDRANDPNNDIRYDGQPGGTQKMGFLNRLYFEHKGDYQFVLRDGRTPSSAVDAIFRGPTRLECNSMMIAIEYRAIKSAIGRERFNRAFKGPVRKVKIIMAAAKRDDVLGPYLKTIEDPTEAKVEPGDWVYFANHSSYLDKHPAGAWQGENALCVGKNAAGQLVYSGFGVSKVTAHEMNLELKRAYNAPRTSQDEATAWRDLSAADKQRVTWMKDHSIVVAADEDAAIAKAEAGLNLSIDEFDYTLIDDTPGATLILVEWAPLQEQFPLEIELSEVEGLVQCFRLDFKKLQRLGAPDEAAPQPVLTGSPGAPTVGIAGRLGD
ncbi:MAG TPA: hypothetical protein DEA08_19310 [Planctomycetes bacterium]|nr:hypothetical protein [Planctomycetota bacterium]|tara:strand:+ start:414 stop:1511 length:1098 start_codon:yes stop_codon:yes gene_type:complete